MLRYGLKWLFAIFFDGDFEKVPSHIHPRLEPYTWGYWNQVVCKYCKQPDFNRPMYKVSKYYSLRKSCCVCGCVGVQGGQGGGVKGDTVAHRLKVVKTPAPNVTLFGLHDLRGNETYNWQHPLLHELVAATSYTGAIDWVPQILRGNDWILQNTGVRKINTRNGSYWPP